MNFVFTLLLFTNLHNELQSILPTAQLSQPSIEADVHQSDDVKRTAVSVCISSSGYDDRGGIGRIRAAIQQSISQQTKYHPTLARVELRTVWNAESKSIITQYYVSIYYPNAELATMS